MYSGGLWQLIGHATTHVVLGGRTETLCGQTLDDGWRPHTATNQVRCSTCSVEARRLMDMTRGTQAKGMGT